MDGLNLSTASDVYVGNQLARYVYIGSTKVWDYKTTPVYTAPTAKSGLVYSGSAQSLLNAGSTSHGTIYYSSNNTDWSTTIPSSTNASTSITVYWKLVGDGRHYDVASTSVTCSIAKANQNAPTATGASVSYGNTATATASGGGGQGSIEWSNGNTLSGNVGSKKTKARWSGNSNYNASAWSNEVTLAITKINPTISVPSAKTGLTYNGSSQILYNAGSNTTAGSFSYSNGTRTDAGDQIVSWSFTPTDTTNYNTFSGSFYGTIAQASPSVSGKSLTYNRGSQALTSKTGDGTFYYRIGTSGSFSTTAPSSTNAGTYTIYWYSTSGTNYKASGSSSSPNNISTTIAKVTPVLSTSPTYRTGLSYTGSAQNLLTGGAMKHSSSDTTAVAGTFTYDQGTNAGTYTNKKWYFAPTDTTNYNSTNGTVTGSASIAKVNAHTAPVANNATYSGSAIALLKNGSANNKGTLEYSSDNSTWSTTVPTQTNAGTYTTYWRFTPTDTTNYNTISSTSVRTTIAKANRTISFIKAPSSVVVGSTITVNARPSAGMGDGIIRYHSTDTSKATVSGYTVTGVSSGTVTITADISAGVNYKSATTSYSLTVEAATLELNPTTINLVSEGTAQTVTVTSNTTWDVN